MNRLDDLGISPVGAQAWRNRKSRWRKALRRTVKSVDDLVSRSNKGIHIPMSDLYFLGRQVADVGQRGITLRVELPPGIKVGPPAEMLAGACKVLESASRVLEAIAVRQHTPLVDFPRFVSSLHVKAEVDIGALAALDDLVKEVER